MHKTEELLANQIIQCPLESEQVMDFLCGIALLDPDFVELYLIGRHLPSAVTGTFSIGWWFDAR
jgi:hypothetical protein